MPLKTILAILRVVSVPNSITWSNFREATSCRRGRLSGGVNNGLASVQLDKYRREAGMSEILAFIISE